VSVDGPRILQVDVSPEAIEFVSRADAGELSQVGAACPDHLVHTKRRPVWVPFEGTREGPEELRERLVAAVEAFHEREREYFETNRSDGDVLLDPSPRVVLIEGVAVISVGRTLKAATLARDLYRRAIAVMTGATSLGEFTSLDDAESFAVEYWPLELYKLSLASPPRELEGRVVYVTGGAGGIGSAVAAALTAEGACAVLADLDEDGARRRAQELGPAVGVSLDVTDEASVVASYRAAALAYGGVDIVVSNAGIASSALVVDTTVELWDRNHNILARGYFLVAREAVRILRSQGLGGSIVFIASKNALAAGKGAAAYSTAKAAELHLARCLAEEVGVDRIRVNCVNPDAVLAGSKIWDSSWREERARGYGIEPDELEGFYRSRTTLNMSVLPEDVAAAVTFFASERRSGKSTGNIVNVDGGVASAYPR
jgi:rhamnulose-1-phosphate aldolase/alcohol dehydrogenase